ncbi:PBAN-type neuropeptides-like [Pectinophora gossypiella]|uniref:Pheromone biosynthesis activating neuropeptide n=1 Tax=Pectinophora gossypiella TaxID=13191 RepID=A0A2R4PCU7_PECGO|nr:PBAN-type neuropeptides-like [Pectinophora gossypiella]AVX48909.1 pheromone biosynthesis activating neuropeptide [Pectinophora gossypiella]
MLLFLEKRLFLFLIICFLGFVMASDDLKDDNVDRGSVEPRGQRDRGGLWFGPRLGKRSFHPFGEDNRQTYLRLLEAADALKYYYDQLQFYDAQADDEARVTKKVIFTPKLGRSLTEDKQTERKRYESVDFTPRLGRRLADDMPATPSDHDYYRQDPEQIDSRTKYFSPRLGRNMNFSPRLGRELSFEVYPNKIRVVRSANKTTAT